jgi:hypothetical protein
MAITTRLKNSEPEIYRLFLRFEILTAITVHITVLWHETMYNFFTYRYTPEFRRNLVAPSSGIKSCFNVIGSKE